MDTIRMKINGFEFPVRADATILEASREAYGAKQWDIYIPTLQYLKGVQEEDNSGICVVTVKGVDGLVNPSTTKVEEGMEVFTRSEDAMGAKIGAYMQIMAAHDQNCRECFRTGNCELQAIANHLWLGAGPVTDKNRIWPVDKSGIIVRDENKCVKCGRCVAVCSNLQGIGAIEMIDNRVIPAGGAEKLSDTKCVSCGQCIAACPVGALRERDDVDKVLDAIADPEKYVVIQTAPSLRAWIGEAFGFPVGSGAEGKMVAALKEVGFDKVFDTVFSADLTIMEEANEFVTRLKNGGVLPMTTSCCPAWIKFCEQEYPDLLNHVSSCKSPQQMFGAIAKSYLAEKLNISKDKIVVVSAMPCTAKKFELTRDDEAGAGVPDVDFSLTAREVASLIKRCEIKFSALADAEFDTFMGEGTGAGLIFGVTGGVMEAALRTAADWLSGEDLKEIEYRDIRGMKGVKEAIVKIAGKEIKVAVSHGLANARKLMDSVRDGTVSYDFIEIMSCPGGCVNGGGQPQQVSDVHTAIDIRKTRGEVLYDLDEKSVIRKSHENSEIKTLYAEYLGEPGSDHARQLLHTTYKARG